MSCRFRGTFSSDEKERIETAARAVERVLSRDTRNRPAWVFLRFQTPHDGFPYWGVRCEDGLRVGAETVDELTAALEGLREEELRRREQVLRGAGGSSSEAPFP